MREDWIEVELGQIFNIVSGNTPKGLKEVENVGEIPFFKVSDMNHLGNEVYMKMSNLFLTNEDLKRLKIKTYPKGTVIFPKRGGAILTNKKRVLVQVSSFDLNLMGVVPNAYVNDTYMFHWFKLLDLSRIYDGSNVPQINNKNILPLLFQLAPLPIQRAIVSKIETLFSDLDNGIADLKKAQEQLKIYRQAVLKKAFEGELTKQWRERQTNLPSAEELLDQIKEERQKHYEQQLENWKQAVKEWEGNGKEGKKPAKPQKHKEISSLSEEEFEELATLPKNWKWIKNNELMYYVTSGSRDWKKFYSETGGTYFIRTQDIKTNKLDLNGAAFVDLPENVEGKRSLIEKGDLLMTITGANVGKIAHVDFDISEAYVSQSVALMKYVLKSFSPYLHYYFQSSATGAKFIGAMVYGVGRPVLSLDNMRDAPVSVCSFEEQHQIIREIESRLSVCDKVEQSITEALEKSEALRQSILKKAFEGKLLSEVEIEQCKQTADYEPASVLLERIRKEKKKSNGEQKKQKVK